MSQNCGIGYWVDGHGSCADRREALAAVAAPSFNADFDRVLFDGEEVGFCGSGCGLLHPDGKCGPCEGAESRRLLLIRLGRR
jgi:hypothetical protein